MEMWLWTLDHLQKYTDADGGTLYHSSRQGLTFALADALSWLLAARCQILDVLELKDKGPQNLTVAEGLDGLLAFLTDLCHVQSARASGEAGRICAELVYGYNRHPAWDTEGCASCYQGDGAEEMERLIPGIWDLAQGHAVAQQTGPCSRQNGLEQFARLRARLDGCLTGSRLAKDRAAEAVSKVMIPEALDYPV